MNPKCKPRPTVDQVLPLVRRLYERNHAGCCLHIALDDGNVTDGDVEFCLEWATNEGHADCAELSNLLLLMTKTQRYELYSRPRK